MKIAAPVTSNMPFDIADLDELNVRYTDRHKFEDILKLVKANKEKRINLRMDNIIQNDELEILFAMNNNIHIRLMPEQLYMYKDMDKIEIPYFFDMPVYSYVALKWVLDKTNATDIYIYDDLCYNLPEIKKICSENNVSIRMILNKIPSTFGPVGELETAPIFRPEDKDMLDMYIDTAEFDCYKNDDVYEWNKFNVYYKRWFVIKEWKDELSLLEDDIKFDFPNQSVPLNFTNFKISCRHRCTINNCKKCKRAIDLARMMANEGYEINE